MKELSTSAKFILISIIMIFQITQLSAQYCDPITPVFNADLSANAQSTWISPLTNRAGLCCGNSAPDRCLEFIINLHPDATSINFNIASGAVPPGALFYQIDCGPQIAVGSPICLDGPGPHHLTFCKPGGNTNTFEIVSFSAPVIGPDLLLNASCSNYIFANYYDESTVTWNSIAPGAPGAHNGFLSCISGCDTTFANAPALPPVSSVDYMVCGMDANGCNPLPICDTINVTFIAPVAVTVSPTNYHLCFNEPGIPIVATATGGSGGYFYNWNTGATSSSIIATAGNYQVNVTDTSGCLVAIANSIITQDLQPIIANAGPDQTLCSQSSGFIQLNGTIQTASGGIWSNGSGSFSPSATDLNAVYSPSAAEIASGQVTLQLISTGNNGCDADTGFVTLTFVTFSETITLNTGDVSCNGGSDGFANVSTTGSYSPSNYSLNGGVITSNGNFSNLIAGNYSLQIINSLGCDTVITFTITQPTLLTGLRTTQTNVLCFGASTGSLGIQVNGGTPTYSYSWDSDPIQNSAVATSLPAGTYNCLVTDSKGCQVTVQGIITQPSQLVVNFSVVEPNCYGAANGAISSLITGGVSPYNYSWSTGAISSNLYNVISNNYSLTITDSNGCITSGSVFVGQPTELIGNITPNSVICPDESINLAVNSTGGTGTYSYSWNPSMQITQSINVSPLIDQNYSCTISDNNGCTVNLTTFVSVNYLDPNDLNALISSLAICLNDSVQISGSYTGPDASVVLTWTHSSSNPTTPSYEYPTQSTSYVLIGTNYCNDSISDTVFVVVNSLPTINLAPNFGNVCPEESINFQNLGDNNSSWIYLWSFGNGETSTISSPIYSYNESGAYPISLTLTDANGCTSSSTGLSNAIVNPQAIAYFDMSATSVSFLDPTVQFYNASINATIFNWQFGDGNSSNTINAEHTYNEANTYMVSLFATNIYGCSDSIEQMLTIRPDYELFVPNAFTPNGDDYNTIFNPKSFGVSDKDYLFQIFNRWGELVFESKDPNAGWNGTYAGDIQSQVGVYSWVVYFSDLRGGRHEKIGHVSLLR